MTESTQVLHQLKVATNYSKLAMHKCGPRSFKSGQGAMCKVLYKFGDGKLSLKKLEERLGWDGHEVIRVAEKAQENGYVCFATSKKGKLSVALTDKGTMVVEKRLAAEDRAADEVLEGLTDKERECLLKLTGKVIESCKAMGVDYPEQVGNGRRADASSLTKVNWHQWEVADPHTSRTLAGEKEKGQHT